MKALYEVLTAEIKGAGWLIDGHVHLFSHRGSFDLQPKLKEHDNTFPSCWVGFADIEYGSKEEYTAEKLCKMYSDYIKTVSVVPKDSCFLLATGLTAEDAIRVYESNEDKISGFGEMKLYDKFKGEPAPYKRIGVARKLCNYVEKKGLKNFPIYIHWALRNERDIKKLEGILKDFPGQKIVLCHCGIDLAYISERYEDKREQASWAWMQAVQLARTYTNLWLDVSWDAMKYVGENPSIILQAPADRIFLGTDRNPAKYIHNNQRYTDDYIYETLNTLSKFVRSDDNIRRMFGRPV